MEEQDWDLHAVVRSCAATNSATTTTATTTTSVTTSCSINIQPISNFQPRQDVENNSFCSQDLYFDPRFAQHTSFEELHELCKPFITESPPQKLPLSPLSVLGGLQKQEQQQKPLIHQLNSTRPIQPKRPLSLNGSTISTTSLHAQSPRTKRRKNQSKKVCQVAADALSSDMWSWRKYGQKPIKGSPYPRGYYKCSTSKGCLARKQVERNRSDPSMFIITYTAEHNHPMPTHRNSLAGSTRHKPVTGDSNNKPTTSSPVSSPACHSPATEKQESSSREEKDDMSEDDEFGSSNNNNNMEPADDEFFEGLEELAAQATGDCFSDNFPVSMQLPWLTNNATTTAAGGG